jgi:hypothetical protein
LPSDETEQATKLPYLSLTTLTNYLDRLGEGPIPPRIDKSTLEKYSGGTQAVLLVTLRAMGFIDAAGRTQPSLHLAATSPDERKRLFREYAERTYAEQLELAQQTGTAQQLVESFASSGYSGSTLRKAIVFYLALVEYLGLPNSHLFRPPKQTLTGGGRRVQRRTALAPPVSKTPEPPPAHSGHHGQTRTVLIGDATRITITVDADWLGLPVETITSIRKAIADLEALETRPQDDE